MDAKRERGVIQNEYRNLQGGRKSRDMCMHALALSFFVFWQHRSAISNEKSSNSNINPCILVQNLEF